MRRVILLILLVLPMLLLVFGSGAWTAIHLYWAIPIATVNVSRDADLEINSIFISYTTCGLTRSLTRIIVCRLVLNAVANDDTLSPAANRCITNT